MQWLVHVADQVGEHPQGLARREGRRRAAQNPNALARHLEDVGRPRAGERQVVLGGLERDVRVVIGVLRRMREPEERRVPVLVERVLDRVGPDGGVGERFLRPQDLPDLGQRPRALQMQLGHASDDAVAGVAEGAERGAEAPECDGRESGRATCLMREDVIADSGEAQGLRPKLGQDLARARALRARSLRSTMSPVSD